jgi:trimeric autotransporter adhesin
MKNYLLLFLLPGLLFFSCKNKTAVSNKQNTFSQETFTEREDESEEQDGIKETQRIEFLQTRDARLGYVPKSRLIEAADELMMARRNGTYQERTNALTWTERGPNADAVGPSNGNGRIGANMTSGRVRAILFDGADATNKTVWVGSVSGGLWKTTDITASPATWTLANDFFANISIGSICQHPTNPSIMYFGTGEKTFNADAVRGGGVWKSTDNGVTWNLLANTVNFWNVSKIVCDASGNVYVATIGGGNGLQRSIDGGANWTAITPTTSGGGSRISEMEISSTGRLHVVKGYYNSTATQSGYFYTDNPSTVTSATWTSPAVSFSPVLYNCDLAVNGNTLYALPSSAADETDQVWKSTNGGANWAVTGTTPTITGDGALSSGQGWYCLAIAVDPTNANNVMVGGLNSYRSTDGGATWTLNSSWVSGLTPTSTNYIHADHQTIAWKNDYVLDGGDGGIFYSGNDGATFADRNQGLRLKQFYACAIHPTSANYFLAGAQDNGVHQLNGAGLTSSVEVTGGDGAFVHIDEDEPNYQFGSYVYNNYRRSTNSGSTWASVTANNNGSFINPTDYDDVNNIMYCGGNANQYYRWGNPQSGATLTAVTMSGLASGVVSHVKVSPYTPHRVFFGGGNDPATGTSGGKILRADNANGTPAVTDITGSSMSTNSNVSCIAVGTTDNNLLATFSNYGSIHVWVTTTGGGAAAWTNITGSGLPDIPVRWAMFYPDDNTKAILATEMGIYETNLINGASTVWAQTATFPTVKTNMLQYRFGDNTVLAATHGRGLWTSTITPTSPYVRFASSYTYGAPKAEATGTTTGCRNYTDYTLNMHIAKAPVGAATVTLSIAGGATATEGVDFDFTTNGSFTTPSNVVTFPNGGTTDQPITIRVYNDAEIDAATESFTFNYVVSGTTDAVASPSSQSYTFYITDNDVAPTTTAVETTLNNNKTENIGGNGNYYFYSSAASRLMCRINGASANLGCVSANIFSSGNTWQTFSGGQRSQKVFEITPTTNSGASYTVSLYFTNAELGGKTASALRIAKTNAATMAGANAGNTVTASTTSVAYNGTSWVFTATFTGFSKFFLIDNLTTLPVDLISFNGFLNNQGKSVLQWKTANEYNLRNFEVQRSFDGINFSTISVVNADRSPSSVQVYDFTDPQQAKAVNYYRLRIVDNDSRYKYSTVIKISSNQPQKFVELLQNPVTDNISFIISNPEKDVVQVQLINAGGQIVRKWEMGRLEGNIALPFNNSRPAKGVYNLVIIAGTKRQGLKIAIQ